MLWDEERLGAAMVRLYRVRPELVEDLALTGPMEEPYCGVCSVLVARVNGEKREAGHGAMLDVLMYHDEPTYDVDEEEYLRAIGLAGVLTYRRCLFVYRLAAAVAALAQNGVDPGRSEDRPGSRDESAAAVGVAATTREQNSVASDGWAR